MHTAPRSDVITTSISAATTTCDVYDAHVYNSCHYGALDQAIHIGLNIGLRLIDLTSWLCTNKLLLNSRKSELIIHYIKRQTSDLSQFEINILDKRVKATSSAKTLDVILDTTLSYDKHVSHICHTCYSYLRRL